MELYPEYRGGCVIRALKDTCKMRALLFIVIANLGSEAVKTSLMVLHKNLLSSPRKLIYAISLVSWKSFKSFTRKQRSQENEMKQSLTNQTTDFLALHISLKFLCVFLIVFERFHRSLFPVITTKGNCVQSSDRHSRNQLMAVPHSTRIFRPVF